MNILLIPEIISYSYLAMGIALLIDGPFETIIEKIQEKYKISPVIAAATLVAISSSAPEFATAILDRFFFHNNVGEGTIFGSGIFNILIIIGAVFAAAPKIFEINLKIAIRDCCFYLLSIILYYFIMNSNEKTVWQSFSLILIYGIYFAKLYIDNNNEMMSKLSELTLHSKPLTGHEFADQIKDEKDEFEVLDVEPKRPTIINPVQNNEHIIDVNSPRPNETESKEDENDEAENKEDESDEESYCKTIINSLSCPWNLIFDNTIIKLVNINYLWCSFAVTVIYIILITFGLTYLCVEIGHAFGISPTVSGLLINAPTTSLPDVFASIVLAKKTQVDGAIANAVASNIFDFLICLPFPDFIYLLFNGNEKNHLDSSSNRGFVSILISVIIYMGLLVLYEYRDRSLDVKNVFSIILIALYIIYCIVEIIYH